jgi:hypothetical protein
LLKATNEQLVMKTNETTLNTANIAEARNILLTDSFNLLVEYNRSKVRILINNALFYITYNNEALIVIFIFRKLIKKCGKLSTS